MCNNWETAGFDTININHLFRTENKCDENRLWFVTFENTYSFLTLLSFICNRNQPRSVGKKAYNETKIGCSSSIAVVVVVLIRLLTCTSEQKQVQVHTDIGLAVFRVVLYRDTRISESERDEWTNGGDGGTVMRENRG